MIQWFLSPSSTRLFLSPSVTTLCALPAAHVVHTSHCVPPCNQMVDLRKNHLETTTTEVTCTFNMQQQVNTVSRRRRSTCSLLGYDNVQVHSKPHVNSHFKLIYAPLAMILVIMVTPPTLSLTYITHTKPCTVNEDCQKFTTSRLCIEGVCSAPRQLGDTCDGDEECASHLRCITDGCDCPDEIYSYQKGKCSECRKPAGCLNQRRSTICLDDCNGDGMSYLPLAFAFLIFVSIAFIFSVKIIKNQTNGRLSSSRQELVNEDSPTPNRHRGSQRRLPRDFSTNSLPDYAPPPPYSVAIASSPVLYSQPIVSTIASFSDSNDTGNNTNTNAPPCTTSTVTAISSSTVPTIMSTDKPADA